MTAGNGQGFIIINLRACIRIYAAALSPPRPAATPPPSLFLSFDLESSAPIRRWRCARRSVLSLARFPSPISD
jgi:hypothetical protein